jgi:hypothetical protein
MPLRVEATLIVSNHAQPNGLPAIRGLAQGQRNFGFHKQDDHAKSTPNSIPK